MVYLYMHMTGVDFTALGTVERRVISITLSGKTIKTRRKQPLRDQTLESSYI